jgi:hypothetical protein
MSMNPSPVANVVFDHDHASLERTAKSVGFVPVPLVGAGQAEDASAAGWLIENSDKWDIAFVHIREAEWKALLAADLTERAIVRFSSEGFRPMLLEHRDPLCLRFLRKTSEIRDTQERNDIVIMREALLSPEVRKILCNGRIVPPSLGGLISFREPNRLGSVRMVLEAVLYAWSTGISGSDRQEAAMNALALEACPSISPPEGFTSIPTIRQEIGVAAGSESSARLKALEADLAAELGKEFLGRANLLESNLLSLVSALAHDGHDKEIDIQVVVDCYAGIGHYLERS